MKNLLENPPLWLEFLVVLTFGAAFAALCLACCV